MSSRHTANSRNVKSAETVDGHSRPKDFLTPGEVAELMAASKGSRYPFRDRAIVQVMFLHGLRVSELTALRIRDVDQKTSRLWVHRLKHGLSTDQPVIGEELRTIKRYLATRTDCLPWLFVSERGGQLTRQAVSFIIREMAERACLPNVHPHTLRHSCGYALANSGKDQRLIQDYLGHRNPAHTAHYTRTACSSVRGAVVMSKKTRGYIGIADASFYEFDGNGTRILIRPCLTRLCLTSSPWSFSDNLNWNCAYLCSVIHKTAVVYVFADMAPARRVDALTQTITAGFADGGKYFNLTSSDLSAAVEKATKRYGRVITMTHEFDCV